MKNKTNDPNFVLKPQKHSLVFRQIHLDFHTSGEISDVGVLFNKKQFQEALQQGEVDSITLFSKCHHGFSYHPTKIGTMHPGLRRNLLAEQIEACREIKVRCPIYLSAGLDELMAEIHPDWVVKQKNGKTFDPLEAGRFHALRWNCSYLDYLCDQIEEVNQLWPDNDGIFLDIIGPRLDYSPASLREMRASGLDPARDEDVLRHAMVVLEHYFARTTASCLVGNPARPVFHNGGNIPIGAREAISWNSHLELESLPTGGWGWDHFPLTARYAQTTGFDFLGMTGKFHTTWGEFGGYKRAASLRYECGTMLAMGAKCSIGDQLHPSGEMNKDTYRLIGQAYSEVKAKEPWCRKAYPFARIAIVSSENEQGPIRSHWEKNASDEGASRMLLEIQQPFVVLDDESPWDDFEAVILPDGLQLHSHRVERLQAYLDKGGKVLGAGSSLLLADRSGFAANLPFRLHGLSAFSVDYLQPEKSLPEIDIRSPLVIHGGAWNATHEHGAEILASRLDPYLERGVEAFFGHQHAPDSHLSPYAGILACENAVWFAHDLFKRYRIYGQPLYRDYFQAALTRLFHGELPVTCTLPSMGRTALFHQPETRRFILHALFAAPTTRGAQPLDHMPHLYIPQIEIIEELIPLYRVRFSIKLLSRIQSVRTVPDGRELSFSQTGNRVEFEVPEILGHQMVEFVEV